MLRLENVSVTLGEFTLKADVSVPSGKLTAILGPSGSGKSTLLSTIAGYLSPDDGRVLWQETDITNAKPGARPISILFQDNNLFPHLTISQNVGMGLRPSLKLTKSEAEQVEEVLERVELGGFGPRKPAALSGGQQSRAAIARVLLADRPLVLLDEPFSALGPSLKSEMLGLIQSKLCALGKTVVMITHDPRDAEKHSDYTLFIDQGVASAIVPTPDIFTAPPAGLKSYLGDDYPLRHSAQ